MFRLILTVTVLVALTIVAWSSTARLATATVIATDDFESYGLGTIIDKGAIGSGWESAYSGLASERGSTPLRDVVYDAMTGTGYNKSLALGHSELMSRATNNNIIERSFAPQSDPIYIGFAFMMSGFDTAGESSYFEGDFFQLYVNDTSNDSGTVGSQNDSLSCGADVNPEEGSGYFARKGGEQTLTATVPTNDVVHRMVMKVSRSGPWAAGVYDEIAVFLDRDTEVATPDAARVASEETSPTCTAISKIHLRIWGMELDDRVYIDDLRIATTYEEALPVIPPPVPKIPGDTDGNKIVDEVDAAVLAEHWGSTGLAGGFGVGDFNADGAVDVADAAVLAANWGSHVPEGVAGVPEPGAIGLLVVLALAAFARRPRR